MRRIVLLILLILLLGSKNVHLSAQEVDSTFRFYFYDQRYSLFQLLPDTQGEIIMLGNSITNGANWEEIFNNIRIKNRGISGDNTFGILHRLEEITSSGPDKVFLLIGINDLSKNTPVAVILNNYRRIVLGIQRMSPGTRIYVQSLMPTNNEFPHFPNAKNKDHLVREVNLGIKEIARETGVTFIDLYPHFLSADGQLDKAFTNDGLHLSGEGYLLWAKILRPYIEEDANPAVRTPAGAGDLYYTRRRAMHEALPVVPGGIVMLGNSLTEQGFWNELLPGKNILNRGIGGDNLTGMLDRLPPILKGNPSALFIMGGINNILFYNTPPAGIAEETEKMIRFIREQNPGCAIFIQSILPINEIIGGNKEFLLNRHSVITRSNDELRQLAKRYNAVFIDMYPAFSDGFQRLKAELTTDGIHLNAQGYLQWADILKSYIK
jgi:lysophospholipase L1-like esterase